MSACPSTPDISLRRGERQKRAINGLMHRNMIGETLTYRDGRVGGDTWLGLLPTFPSGNVELYEDFIGCPFRKLHQQLR
jgi:hypothetical protein